MVMTTLALLPVLSLIGHAAVFYSQLLSIASGVECLDLSFLQT